MKKNVKIYNFSFLYFFVIHNLNTYSFIKKIEIHI